MKRIIAMATLVVGVAAALILGTAGTASAAAVNTTVDGISYYADDSDPAAGATVTGYTPGSADVVIPSTVTINGQDYSVTTINDLAFIFANISSVTIPDSVTTIDPNAFYHASLTSVTLGDSVTTIGDSAFLNTSLTSLTIPASVTTIDQRAFEDNPLASVTFSSAGSLTTIGKEAFDGDNLTSVTIPDTVTTIGDYAFENNGLTSLSLGDEVTTIGNYAFYRDDLTSVTIPASVTTIGADAFAGNDSLATVLFTGPAPSSISNGATDAPLGAPASVTVLFDVTYAAGYGSPTWDGYPTEEVAAVSYDLNGHGTAIRSHYVTVGSAETRPANPTSDGLTFAGWYTNAALTRPADFSTPITADTTFYAKWSDPAALALTGGTLNPGLGIGGAVALLVGVLLVSYRRRRLTT